MLNHLGFCFFFLVFFLRLGLGQRRAVVIIGRWLLPSLVDTGDICCHYWQHILVIIVVVIVIIVVSIITITILSSSSSSSLLLWVNESLDPIWTNYVTLTKLNKKKWCTYIMVFTVYWACGFFQYMVCYVPNRCYQRGHCNEFMIISLLKHNEADCNPCNAEAGELGQYHGCWWPGSLWARSSAAMLLIM